MDIELWSGRLPQSQADRQAVAEVIGGDGSTLLADIFASDAPALLREIPAVEILRRIWVQNYYWVDGHIHWRSNDDIAPATLAHQFSLRSRSPLRQKARDEVDR